MPHQRFTISLFLVLVVTCAAPPVEQRAQTPPPPAPPRAEEPAAIPADGAAVEMLEVEVLATYPHDPRAFTQGLLWHGGELYESTGHYGASELRRVEPTSGTVLERRALPRELFGEGLARVENRLIQLTWQEGLALVYERETLELVDRHVYAGEGWGLTFDGERLIRSDGTSTLTLHDPSDFSVAGRVDVTLDGRPLRHLNELEWVHGQIYANVWQQERIVRIDPTSGRVSAVIDARGLLTPRERLRVDVLNGIAHDPESGDFWITGKYWPKIFRVRFVPAVAD